MKLDKNVYNILEDCINELLVELQNYKVESVEYRFILELIVECRSLVSSVAANMEKNGKRWGKKWKLKS